MKKQLFQKMGKRQVTAIIEYLDALEYLRRFLTEQLVMVEGSSAEVRRRLEGLPNVDSFYRTKLRTVERLQQLIRDGYHESALRLGEDLYHFMNRGYGFPNLFEFHSNYQGTIGVWAKKGSAQ